MKRLDVIALIILLLTWPDSAAAQSRAVRFELGVQISSAVSSQFDTTDVGVGGRLAWRPNRWLGIETEITHYPGDFPDPGSFSRARWEGLFGLAVGATFDRVRPFARARPGFVSVRGLSEPIACILIFPPPLACVLASGRNLFALDLGGGLELSVTESTFIRVDAGDRLLRYPGPVFDGNRKVRDDAFFGHDFRFAAGGGLRF